MELIQNLNIDKNNNFLENTLWKTINSGIDIGLKFILPDMIENQIIDIKNNLINFGLKDGIEKSINSVLKLGKEALGIFTKNFENIGQVQSILKNGGLVEKISDVLDLTINKAQISGKINSEVGKVLKKEKSTIVNNIDSKLQEEINKQIKKIDKIEKSINIWKENYNIKNFDEMEKEYLKIKRNMKDLVPLENTIKEARNIEMIHELIKNNGKNFELSEEEIELAKKLNI